MNPDLEEIAADKNTRPQKLKELARFSIELARIVAKNASADLEILQELSVSSDVIIRQNIASNPNTPQQALEKLANHYAWPVRATVANNFNTPVKVLEQLIEDDNYLVEEEAINSISWDISNHPIVEEFAALKHNKIDLDRLTELANSSLPIIRILTARHPKTPASVLAKLAIDPCLDVRLAVAQSPHTPIELLKSIAQQNNKGEILTGLDPCLDVRMAVALHPNWSIEQCKKTIEKDKEQQIHSAAIKNLLDRKAEGASVFLEQYAPTTDEPDFNLIFILLHPMASSQLLTKHHKSWYWLIRYAIAQNPNTPLEICQKLAQDANIIVRTVANISIQEKCQS